MRLVGSIIIAPVVAVLGVLLGTALTKTPRILRKRAAVSSGALMGASLFLYATATTPAASVGFNAMESFCTSIMALFVVTWTLLTRIRERVQSTFNTALHGWTPEAFSAAVCGSKC